jgi:methyl-accepting chemotaxis protein WspA
VIGDFCVKNWTVRLRIQASFALIITIMVLMTATSYVRLEAIEVAIQRVTADALPGMYGIAKARNAWSDHMSATRRILGELAGESGAKREEQLAAGREVLQNTVAEQDKWLETYKKSTSDAAEQAIYQEILAGRDSYFKQHQQFFALLQGAQIDQAKVMLETEIAPPWRATRAKFDRLIVINKELVESANADIIDLVAASERIQLIAVILAILAALVSGFLLMQAVLQPVRKVVAALDEISRGDLTVRLELQRSDEFNVIQVGFNSMAEALKKLVAQSQMSAVKVATSSTEIAATSREQQATATETAATATEIGATSREISATARELVRTMSDVSTMAENAAALASAGQEGLARMAETMHLVAGASELVNGKLAILNEKASNINQVVSTIVKVADQTNLLSMNAAIEAEKAGEYGRGFAVVANEVRRLADQTAVATYDIEQMLGEVQSAVSAGVMGMDKFSEEVRRGLSEVGQVGEQLSQVIHQVQNLAPQVHAVSEGMHDQATSAEQINQALIQLGEATGQTVDALRLTSASIDELTTVASGLRSSVSAFKV